MLPPPDASSEAGYEALAVGDYGTQAGPLDVPTHISERLAQAVIDRDIDLAISRRMEIDHGAVQPLEILFGDIGAKPVVPIFVNSVAKPFTSMRRIRQMGTAVGEFLSGLDERVRPGWPPSARFARAVRTRWTPASIGPSRSSSPASAS